MTQHYFTLQITVSQHKYKYWHPLP